MSIPKVTVLMSVYNGKTFLAEAISSILNQTFRDFEFLIINDGSSEPVDQVIESFHDERIRYVEQENMGLTKALNRGLALARGKYVARMDADDVSLPERLQAQVDAMDSHEGLDLVGTFFDVINASGAIIEKKELITDDLYRLWRLQFHNNYGHGTMMMRRSEIIRVGNYDESLQYAQDYDLWSRVSKRGNTRILSERLYLYRMVENGGQASVKNYDAQFETTVRISDRNLSSCNRSLTEELCAEVRALYWKFQRDRLSAIGLSLVVPTLEGFMGHYELSSEERGRLAGKVALDVMKEAQIASNLSASMLANVLTRLRRMPA
jgi:glycosyltransferase involved in cell wall biosynthesis